jgi:hypothetical protein
MKADIDLFRWTRPVGGFEWIDAKAFPQRPENPLLEQETRFLAERHVDVPSYGQYNPLVSNPTLFKEFASLVPTEDGFMAFANEHGPLGVGALIAKEGPLETYEPLYRWRAAHLKMREVVDVLNAIDAKDVGTLQKWFTLTNNGARFVRDSDGISHWTWVTISGQLRSHIWEWAAAASTPDIAMLRVAQGWCQVEINEALDGGTNDTHSALRVIFDGDKKEMTLRVCPTSLLAALWLQCARSLTMNPQFRTCNHCGRWFELSPDARRRQAIYCSPRCKVAAYRKRKTAATTG